MSTCKRMWTDREVRSMAGDTAKQLIDINAVKKIKAPSSTTLKDEEIAAILDGVFIEGSFLGVTNPVLTPPKEYENVYQGMIIYELSIGYYNIVKSTKVISLGTANTKNINLRSVTALNGKLIPDYPAETGTFVLKIVDGVITWVSE